MALDSHRPPAGLGRGRARALRRPLWQSMALAPVLLACAAVFLAPILSPAAAARLIGIRTGNHEGRARVVFDLDEKVQCSLARVGEGEDWEVLLAGVCPSIDPPTLAAPHPLIVSIDGRCEGSTMRVVLRGSKRVDAAPLELPPGDGRSFRYVVDLRPAAEGVRGENVDADAPPPVERKETKEQAPTPEPSPRRSGPWRIFVDPGHGGADPGATYRGLREKEIVLDVARRVAKILNEKGGFDARLSRSDDRLIPLRQRMRLAEAFEADAFLSIHANASRKSMAIGVEVFFLSLGSASDEASREVARLENEADPDYVVEEDSLLKGIPFGFDLRQSDTLRRSSRLSESILTAVESSGLAASRGVKQAGFAVLKSYQVPSSLIEIGFLSNPKEAKRLKDAAHRQRLAECIVQGTVSYFEHSARAKAETKEARDR